MTLMVHPRAMLSPDNNRLDWQIQECIADVTARAGFLRICTYVSVTLHSFLHWNGRLVWQVGVWLGNGGRKCQKAGWEFPINFEAAFVFYRYR